MQPTQNTARLISSVSNEKIMNFIHSHEELIIKNFFQRTRRERYFEIRNKEKQRSKWLDKLNHTPGLETRYTTWLTPKDDAFSILKSKGAPEKCFVISCFDEIDKKEMKLLEAIEKTKISGWGTIIGCIPGKLGFYYGELGESSAIIERK